MPTYGSASHPTYATLPETPPRSGWRMSQRALLLREREIANPVLQPVTGSPRTFETGLHLISVRRGPSNVPDAELGVAREAVRVEPCAAIGLYRSLEPALAPPGALLSPQYPVLHLSHEFEPVTERAIRGVLTIDGDVPQAIEAANI